MPPQQSDRLLDRIDIALGLWAHGVRPARFRQDSKLRVM
jgi:hypothetical protein